MDTQVARNDLIVIGAGTSGYVVAIGALRCGWRNVVLIDKSASIGGAALHASCIPSKSLIHIANVAHTTRQATQYGLDSYLMAIDFKKIAHYITNQVQDLALRETQETQATFRQLGGKILQGKAQFIDAHTLQIDNKKISADYIVIATGSRPQYPEIKGLDQIGYYTNETLLRMPKLPEKLAILGNEPAAFEYAQAFARLGSKVSLIIAQDAMLPQQDPELIDQLRDLLTQEGIEIFVNSNVHEAYAYKEQCVLACTHTGGDEFLLTVDAVLVAQGRRPNIEELALENAGIEYAPAGVIVNDHLQTSQKHIYAVGDVTISPYKLTHAAEYQANIVLSNMLHKANNKVNYQGFPYVIFTDPEYAQVGLSEQQAFAQGLQDLKVTRFDFNELDSAVIKNVNRGRIKVLSHNDKVIGVSILGPEAGNLLAEWGLAVKLGASVADVASTIHAYPTLAQINRRVASKYLHKLVHGKRVSKAWMQRMLAWG